MNSAFKILGHKSGTYAFLMKISLMAIFFSLSNTVRSDDVWESFGTTASPWTVSKDLKCYSNTTSKVDIKNMNYESEENKRNNTWSTKTAWINAYNETPIDIDFKIRNIVSPSIGTNTYHTDGKWYWQVEINYTTLLGTTKYFRFNYCKAKYTNSSSIYESSCTTDNGTQSEWKEVTKWDYRRFRILFENSNISIFDNNGNNIKTIYSVKSVQYIQVGAGPGTNLEITNTSCKKATIYGQALPYLERATKDIDNNKPASAASEMTTAINKGLKCFHTYLIRGIAYYTQGYYKSAIEDLSMAISYYSSTNKEVAYYYRGLCKLAIDDDYGVNDLRNGGQNGMVFLRENNLLNYTPGQSKKTTTTNKSGTTKNSSSQSKKPALHK